MQDHCRLRDAEDADRRYFSAHSYPSRCAETDPCCWGLRIEVDAAAFHRVWDLWDSPEQVAEPPIPGVLANHIADYPETVGLPGMLQLTGPTTAPRFTLAPDLAHPLAREQREGVHHGRVLEWLDRQLHS